MKKTIGVLLIAAMSGLVACGPSAEEQKAHDDSLSKAINDSIALVQQQQAEMQKAYDDSVANAAKMAEMQRVNDSLTAAAAASEKKAKAATTKPKTPAKPKNEPAPTDPTKVKPGQGRG